MKKIFQILTVATFLVTSSTCFAISGDGTRFLQYEEAVKSATYGHIDARGLKALMDANSPFVLLDARGKSYSDPMKIPGSKLAHYKLSQEEIEEIVPDKNDLIVVYCFSFGCPLSRNLADKLVELGYKNVLEYPAGLKEWRDIAEYPALPMEK